MEVRILRLDQSFPDGPDGDTLAPHVSLEPFLEVADAQTRQDVSKFRFLNDARRCLLGRLLPRSALAEKANVPSDSLRFEITRQGRPHAVHNALGRFPFDFNTSHDSNLVAVATLKRDGNSKRRIGVDVMKVRNPWEGTTTDEFLEGISAQLTESERTKIDSLGTDERAKLRHALALWTLKESYVKATGEGLHHDLSQIGFDINLPRAARHDQVDVVGSVCLSDRESVDKWTFDLVEVNEGENRYLVALAQSDSEDGRGRVRWWAHKPDWIKFVTLHDVLESTRNGSCT